jgi:hypothetical protein
MKECAMRNLIMGLIVIAAASVATATAQARDYPYCLTSRGYGYPGECSYTSYRQCMASASGRLADCIVNPRVAFGEQRRSHRRRW